MSVNHDETAVNPDVAVPYRTPSYAAPADGATYPPQAAPPPYRPAPETYAAPAPYAQAPSYSNRSIAEGQKHAQNALIFGILAMVVFSPLSIVALIQVRKAEALGVSATPGKVLGWISLVSLCFGVLMLAFVFVSAILQQGT